LKVLHNPNKLAKQLEADMKKKYSAVVQCLLVITIVFGFSGCFQSVILKTTAIENSNENNIVVSTKDGRQFSFNSDQYSLATDENGQQVIRGNGKVYHQGKSQFKSFEGSIPIDDIDRITTSEKTAMYYVSIATAAAVVGYAIIWAIALNGRGFGG
jgi:hypothetical protein